MRNVSSRSPRPAVDARLRGVDRFVARSVLGWFGVVLGLLPFLVLWLLIREGTSALPALDRAIAAELNESVRAAPHVVVDTLTVVTDLAGTTTAVLAFTLTTIFLALRRSWRLAAFAATTGVGLAVLVTASKALIDRARPVVEAPVAELPGNASFPSGHSMTAVVLWGALVLIALPAVRRPAGTWLVGGAVVLVLVLGGTRLALGVHFLSDVLAGWALGVAWLAVMVVSFRAWPGHRPGTWETDPLQQESGEVVDLGNPRRAGVGVPARDLTRLLGVAATIPVVLVPLGLLVTGPWQDTWLGRWDRRAVDYMVEVRSSTLTDVATAVSMLSDTATVVGAALAIGVLALAVTGTWRPMLFVSVALTGETLLYLTVSRLVDRPRPAVADLTSGLPAAASWPSGHVAAAVVLYGAFAAVLQRSSRRARRAAVTVAVLVPLAVAASRLYLAAHYPTDVLAALVLGAAWLLACLRWLPPSDPLTRGLGQEPGARSPDVDRTFHGKRAG